MTLTLTDLSLLTLTVLAEDEPHNTGPDFGKASPFGLFIVVVLLIATFGLVWSMNRHLKKVPESFDEADAAATDTDGPDSPEGDRPPRDPGD
jgi:hypothetical protein